MAALLIIDDDDHEAMALARLLEAEGHSIHCAATVTDALRFLRQEPPDLVLLDLTMPHVSGMDLLDALGGEAQFAHIPIALYTGHNDAVARDTALQLGACEYILKGEPWEVIRNQIEHCLQHQHPA